MVRRFLVGISALVFLGSSLAIAGAAPAAAASPRCFGDERVLLPPRAGWPDQRRLINYPVENSATHNWRCVMSRGGQQARDSVITLQASINYCYINTGRIAGFPDSAGGRLDVDGVYGSLTREAVIRVQRYHRIGDDGIYGPQTAGTVYHYVEIWYGNGSQAFGCSTLAQAEIP
jgi:peptidoglycan hydrolase-like protein with peptidoglycan-binding domain